MLRNKSRSPLGDINFGLQRSRLYNLSKKPMPFECLSGRLNSSQTMGSSMYRQPYLISNCLLISKNSLRCLILEYNFSHPLLIFLLLYSQIYDFSWFVITLPCLNLQYSHNPYKSSTQSLKLLSYSSLSYLSQIISVVQWSVLLTSKQRLIALICDSKNLSGFTDDEYLYGRQSGPEGSFRKKSIKEQSISFLIRYRLAKLTQFSELSDKNRKIELFYCYQLYSKNALTLNPQILCNMYTIALYYILKASNVPSCWQMDSNYTCQFSLNQLMKLVFLIWSGAGTSAFCRRILKFDGSLFSLFLPISSIICFSAFWKARSIFWEGNATYVLSSRYSLLGKYWALGTAIFMMRSVLRSLQVKGLGLYRIFPVSIWKRRYYSLSKCLSDYYLGRVDIGMSYFWQYI